MKLGLLIVVMLAMMPIATALTATLHVPTPDGSNNFYAQNFVVSVTTDANIIGANLTIDSEAPISMDYVSVTNYTATVSVVGREGSFSLQSVVWNSTENATTDSTDPQLVKIDSIPPGVTEFQSNSTSVALTDSIELTVQVNDVYPDHATISLGSTQNNVSVSSGTGTLVTTPQDLGCPDNSNCTLDVTAYDEAGNSDQDYLVIEVGSVQQVNASLTIAIKKPQNESLISDSNLKVELEITAEDPPAQTVFCKYELIDQGTSVTSKFGNYFTNDFDDNPGDIYNIEFDILDARDGDYELRITCFDDDQKSYSESVYFVLLDTTPPFVIIDIADVTKTTATVEINSSELFEIKSLEYKILGEDNATEIITTDDFDNVFLFNLAGLKSGFEYVVQAKGIDKSGDLANRDQNEFISTERFTTGSDQVIDKQKSDVTSKAKNPVNKTFKLNGTDYFRGIDLIEEGEPAVVTITNFDIIVRSIEIAAKESLRNIKLEMITSEQAPPALLNKPPSKSNVFHYISIETLNAPEDMIKHAKVRFEVTETWLSNNEISVENIALFRWKNNKWDQLPTSLVKEGALLHEYEALTSGFSVFAIAEKIGVKKEGEEEVEVEVLPEEEEEAEEETKEEIAEPETQIPWRQAVYGVILLFVLIFVVQKASSIPKSKPLVKVKSKNADYKHIKENMKRLEKFIDEALAKGHSVDSLKQNLIESGWDAKLVEFVLRRR